MDFLYEFKDSEKVSKYLIDGLWLQTSIYYSLSSFDFQSRPISALLQGKNDQIYFFQAEVMHRSKLIIIPTLLIANVQIVSQDTS